MTRAPLHAPAHGVFSVGLVGMIALSFLTLTSCSVDARITLDANSTAVEADLTASPQMRSAWASLRALDSTLPADPFDAALLKAGLGPSSSVISDAKGTHLKFAVDPRKIAPDLKDASGWEITLDRAAVRRLAAMTSWKNSPALDAVVPPADTPVTEADYRDLLSYLLGPDATGKAVLDASTVKLAVTAPRPIRSAPGAEISGNTATYRWPLVKLLALETPITIKLVY